MTTTDIGQPQLQVPIVASTELALATVNALRSEMAIRSEGADAAVIATREFLEQVIAKTAAEISHVKGRQIEAVHGEINTAIAKLHGEIDTEIAKVRGELIPQSSDVHARVSVLERQMVDQKDNTALALAAADKAIINAVVVADKAVAKVELAAEKTYLESAIAALASAFKLQIDFQKQTTEQGLAAADKAVAKAEAATEKRFESVNEFRSTLADQQRDLATKSEVNLRFIALEGRINAVVEEARENRGRGLGIKEHVTEGRLNVGQVIAAIVMFLLALSVVFAAITVAIKLH